MGLFSPNPAKLKQIELQNILFNTNEKKLMVSTEFLSNMTTNYVSKRMKNINRMAEGLVSTKHPKNFFAYCDVIDNDLEELIRIEKYHNFKDPVPSEFKKLLASKMERYTTAMINRTWRDASQKIGLTADGKRDPRFYGPVLEEILNYQDKYTRAQLDLIDKFYISVYDESFRLKKEEPEVPESEEETAETAETNETEISEGEAAADENENENENETAEDNSSEEETAE